MNNVSVTTNKEKTNYVKQEEKEKKEEKDEVKPKIVVGIATVGV